MACLKEEEDSATCSDLARAYLQCRMDRYVGFQDLTVGLESHDDLNSGHNHPLRRDLMAKQSLHELGFMEGTSTARTTQPSDTAADRQSEGFIAGTGQRERRAAQGQELPPLKRGH